MSMARLLCTVRSKFNKFEHIAEDYTGEGVRPGPVQDLHPVDL